MKRQGSKEIREKRNPILIHAKVPLLNHHTSGVRMEWYRDYLKEAKRKDPFPKLKKELLKNNFTKRELLDIERVANVFVSRKPRHHLTFPRFSSGEDWVNDRECIKIRSDLARSESKVGQS